MKPAQIIEHFQSTVEVVLRKRFLRDEERYHQIVGAYDLARSLSRAIPGEVPEDIELPEHFTSAHLSELERLFRNFCVPLNISARAGQENAEQVIG